VIHVMHPAIFLDRDGVIIENRPNHIRSWADVAIYPQALAGLAKISGSPYKVVIVTNQSGIGRGLISTAAAREINSRLLNEIEVAGGRVEGVFVCPHIPEEGCDCRKPKPGLFFQAALRMSLDLSQSFVIGDALTDLKAGRLAGIPQRILVRTGRGPDQISLPEAACEAPLSLYDNLADALAELFNSEPPTGFQ